MSKPCSGKTDLFFSTDKADEKRAKELCAGCPMRVECAVKAVRNRDQYGVWGGFTYKERRRHFKVELGRAS